MGTQVVGRSRKSVDRETARSDDGDSLRFEATETRGLKLSFAIASRRNLGKMTELCV